MKVRLRVRTKGKCKIDGNTIIHNNKFVNEEKIIHSLFKKKNQPILNEISQDVLTSLKISTRNSS